jgi:hypothetical protein
MEYGERPPGCPSHIDAICMNGDAWPTDKPFPYTAEECLWAMMGYAVLPKSGPLTVEDWQRMIYRKWELVDGRLAPS